MPEFKTYWKYSDGVVLVTLCSTEPHKSFYVSVNAAKAVYSDTRRYLFYDYDEAFAFALRMARVLGDCKEVA